MLRNSGGGGGGGGVSARTTTPIKSPALFKANLVWLYYIGPFISSDGTNVHEDLRVLVLDTMLSPLSPPPPPLEDSCVRHYSLI